MLAAALAYAEHGWPVFPLRGKVPARLKAQGGRGFYDATTSRDVVERMWSDYPGANIGIRCGSASGLAVLDVDPDKGGIQSLARIEEARGVLPHTVVQVTGGEGLHLLYQHRPGIGIGSNVWGPGLDLRGEGGYIVAAPSVHPETGHAYSWAGDDWRHPLAPWPEQLPTSRPKPPAVTSSFRPRGRGPLAGLVAFVLDAGDGERNTRLNWAAYRAGEHVRRGTLDAREAAAALYAAATRIGLDHREAVATIASGLGSSVA